MSELWLAFIAGGAFGGVGGAIATTAWVAKHDRRSAGRLLGLMPTPSPVDSRTSAQRDDIVPSPNGRA